MSEELDATAALAYEAYRGSRQGTIAGGLPMPVWEHLSVPERDAWLAVATAVYVPPDPPIVLSSSRGPGAWTQGNLENMTVSDLRDLVQEQDGLHVPSSATKQDIIDVLLAHQAGRSGGHG